MDADDLSETGRLAVLARGHDAVVRAAVDAGPVLPLRFGTVVADEDGARRLLRKHAAPPGSGWTGSATRGSGASGWCGPWLWSDRSRRWRAGRSGTD